MNFLLKYQVRRFACPPGKTDFLSQQRFQSLADRLKIIIMHTPQLNKMNTIE